MSCASATHTLAWAAATISGRASESRKAVARLIGKRRSVGSSGACFSFTVPKSLAGRGGGIGRCGRAGGNGAGDAVWVRHGHGSNPWSIKVATMIVAKRNRSIGRGSIPCPPGTERAARPIRLGGL